MHVQGATVFEVGRGSVIRLAAGRWDSAEAQRAIGCRARKWERLLAGVAECKDTTFRDERVDLTLATFVFGQLRFVSAAEIARS